MTFQYDMRLTIRNPMDKKLIKKQLYLEALVFTNPVSPGDNIVLPNFRTKSQESDPVFWSHVEAVNHSPGLESKSYIEAEYQSGCADIDRIEKFLFDNYKCRDIL